MTAVKKEPEIAYSVKDELQNDEVKSLWKSSGFLRYNPDFDWAELPTLLSATDIIVAARHGGRLVGMTRAVTDYCMYCCLIDIMVDEEYSRHGIGRELSRLTRESAGKNVWLVAMAQDSVAGFYRRSGFSRVEGGWSAWILTPPQD